MKSKKLKLKASGETMRMIEVDDSIFYGDGEMLRKLMLPIVHHGRVPNCAPARGSWLYTDAHRTIEYRNALEAEIWYALAEKWRKQQRKQIARDERKIVPLLTDGESMPLVVPEWARVFELVSED